MGFWEPLFFWICAIGAIASSVMVVVWRNPLYSAIFLILDFFFFAGLYALLSAHFLAVTQILVYTGAIMVLFLFIIMLLNLKDDELGEFEFKLHHFVAAGSVLALFVFMVQALLPLRDIPRIESGRAEAQEVMRGEAAEYSSKESRLEGIEDAATRTEKLAELSKTKPKLRVATPTGLDGEGVQAPPCAAVGSDKSLPGLFQDLNEGGLEHCFTKRVEAWDAEDPSKRIHPARNKYRRFDPTRAEAIPPRLTGKRLETERGVIEAGEPAGFGTIQPLSVLLINRFVVPFQLTALLLLAAIVGAVIIAKRRL